MNPNRCDDWMPDEHQREKDKNGALSVLLLGAWKLSEIDRIARYDDVVIEGVRYHGWALWLDHGPETPAAEPT